MRLVLNKEMVRIISLDICPENTRCILIESDLSDSLKSKLMSLGWLPGREIKVIRRAPFGDPTIYLVDSTEISLRQDESKMIKVEPLYPASLSVVPKGTYVVLNFTAGKFFSDKVRNLGIEIGKEIQVLSDPSNCKISIMTNGGEFLIGHGMGQKILVKVR
ncbi:MAG: ferrous iron transport protein A [Thermotogae bacterium]|nr:ferrous iron transport protein A [Thermotogota bacterium]